MTDVNQNVNINFNAVDNTSRVATTIQGRISSMTASAGAGMKRMAAMAGKSALAVAAIGAAAGAAAYALGKMTIGAADRIEGVSRSAKVFGESVSDMDAIQYATLKAGASLEYLEMAMKNLAIRVGDGSNITAGAADSLKALGIEADSFASKSKIQQIQMLADGVAGLGDSAKSTAALIAIIGDDAAVKLAPLLQQGGGSIVSAMKESSDLSGGITEQTAKTAHILTQTMSMVSKAWEGVKNTLVTLFGDTVTGSMKYMVASMKTVREYALATGQIISEYFADNEDSIMYAMDIMIEAAKIFGTLLFDSAKSVMNFIGNGFAAIGTAIRYWSEELTTVGNFLLDVAEVMTNAVIDMVNAVGNGINTLSDYAGTGKLFDVLERVSIDRIDNGTIDGIGKSIEGLENMGDKIGNSIENAIASIAVRVVRNRRSSGNLEASDYDSNTYVGGGNQPALSAGSFGAFQYDAGAFGGTVSVVDAIKEVVKKQENANEIAAKNREVQNDQLRVQEETNEILLGQSEQNAQALGIANTQQFTFGDPTPTANRVLPAIP